MFILIVCLAVCAFSSTSETELLTKRPSRKPKIVDGDKADISELSYIANLRGCGGVIIDKIWILTAGHCSVNRNVYLGSSRFDQGELYRVQRSFIHPNYRISIDERKEPMYDFQLLQLTKSIEFNSNVSAIRLGIHEDVRPGDVAAVSGWGRDDRRVYPIFLRKVDVEIIDEEVCRRLYGDELINEAAFCAGVGGKDSCYGDSGGPITNNGRLIGVVSFGDECGSQIYPGVYSKVPYARQWIRNITGI